MLIVCAGRSRSGSTLLYNIVRLTLVEIFGKKNVYGRGINFYKKNQQRKYNIVKLHDSPDRYFWNSANYIFSSVRNEKDQRKSIVAYKRIIKNVNMTEKKLDEFINNDFRRYKKWSQHKNFVGTFKYNNLLNHKEKVIRKVCKTLNKEISKEQIKNIIKEVDSLKLPSRKKKRDPESGLSWHHITGGTS